jgi:ATP-dependent exoDNAse (exonuclease V) alpha subunit
MLSGPDLASLIAYARARGAKIILAGDTSQLQAVENGGGMSLLAAGLGYARLAEPVRFRNQWEQHASLRLRAGDTTVLADYDQHGRVHGGDPEQMTDAAAAAYVALTTGGTDTLLMAADHALRRELNRRIRDDLITLGVVQNGLAVTIADGTHASRGDLIVCTRNDHTVETGEPGRTLANGDLLRIEAVTSGGLVVRRALDADPRTGQRRWTTRTFRYAAYHDAELGYAVTDHAAQGHTVHTGLAVWTPPASWPTRSPNGTWPAPATSLRSLTPGSATGPVPWSRFRPARGPRASPPSPIPDTACSPPRSPR